MNANPRVEPLPVADESGITLSIGAAAREAGIAIETLRTWERRYGFPRPLRTAGGHRLYDVETVERLRLAAQAVASGHRASTVVGLGRAELETLLGRRATPITAEPAAPASPDAQAWIAQRLSEIAGMDAGGLDHALRAQHTRSGTLGFLEQFLGPLLDEIGLAWAGGRLTVSHEHLAAERVRSALLDAWRPIATGNRGAALVFTTLPGELHDLGLHMAACVAAEAGARVVFLGASTPIADIVSAARQSSAAAVSVSVSRAARADSADLLRSLRANLPPAVALAVGGHGAPEGVTGVHRIVRLSDYAAWLDALPAKEATNGST